MTRSRFTLELGRRCLDLDQPVIALGDQLVAVPGPAIGLRCGPQVTALAYPIPTEQGPRVGLVVSRTGTAEVVDPRHRGPLRVTDELTPVVDAGRRALGLATPPEPTPPVVMLDAIWIDRVLAATLRSDLGRPPPWHLLSALHPLAASPIQPRNLQKRRLTLSVGWSAFRRRATSDCAAWPGLSPSLADWLDDGSFARWVLVDLPPTQLLLNDLAELLEPSVTADINEALGGPHLLSRQ